MPVSVCCLEDEGAWAWELREIGVDVRALHRAPGFHPALGQRIARFAREKKAAVLHCHQYSPFVYGQLAAALSQTRVIYTEHGRSSDAPPSVKQRAINPLLGRMPQAICSVSENLKQHMVRAGFPARRIDVIYNGIRIGEAPSDRDRAEARACLGLDPAAFVAGTVSRLDPVKDIPTLVRGFASATRGIPTARLLIVGDGADRAAIDLAIAETGARESVIMAGHRNDVRSLLPALDVYVNASITEGVSLTILEAMAAALPVVATAVGGTPEVVVDGATGRLVQPRNAEALARAIAEVIGAPARRLAWGRAGRERVERMFQLRQMIDTYASLYVRA